ncbi:MAG TPA: hypothetical protein VIM63_13315 [Rhodoferax sp.]
MDSQSQEKVSQDALVSPALVAPSVDALARRRMLIKGLTKGSAVLAASIPLQSLAQSTVLLTNNNLRCSVSGMQSSVHSKIPEGATTCGGYSPGWWGQVENGSDPRKPRRSWGPVSPTAICTATFTKTGTDDQSVDFANKTLFNVMDKPGFANTKTRHWIGAYLNGYQQWLNSFPYSGAEILSFYNLPDSDSKRAAAYTLITTYLETHAP